MGEEQKKSHLTREKLFETYDRGVYERLKARLEREQEEPDFDDNSRSTLMAKYVIKDENRKPIESIKSLVARVAAYVSYPEYHRIIQDYISRGITITPEIKEQAEREAYDKGTAPFYQGIAKREILPNTPTLMNAARKMGLLSACFVLPVLDSIDDIFQSVKDTARIQKAGGGTGFSFSRLRPTGDGISSSGGTTSGPLSFIKVFSEATEAIQQGAFRRGANMGIMRIDHPDIIRFLDMKKQDGKLANFNLSVAITDEWMNSYLTDPKSPAMTRNPRNGDEYFLLRNLNPATYTINTLLKKGEEKTDPEAVKKSSEILTKEELFNQIVHYAWRSGEPGIIFIDKMNRDNPTPKLGAIEATNPCGEQPLLPYESCNLGAINLATCVNEKREIRYDEIERRARLATRFLDDVIDMNRAPTQEVHEMMTGNRKIGLGIMGFADMLVQCRIRYGSPESLEVAEKVMGLIRKTADNQSERLAQEKGPFPNIDKSIYKDKTPRRNACTTTIAPVGTGSIILGAKGGGCEPFFALYFTHTDNTGVKRERLVEPLEKALKEEQIDPKPIIERLAKGESLQTMAEVPDSIKRVYVTTADITPEEHVLIQAAFQKHIDASISKTINFTNTATESGVKDSFILAYKRECKGITVYRDGSRANQPLNAGDSRAKESKLEEKTNSIVPKSPRGGWHNKLFPAEYILEPLKVPDVMPAVKVKQRTSWGNMHVKIVVDPTTGRKYEVFAQLAKGGEAVNADLEATCRIVSAYLRIGGDGAEMAKQLRNIGSNMASAPSREGVITSLPDALGRALEKYDLAIKSIGIKKLLCGEYEEDFFDKVADMQKEGRKAAKKIIPEEESSQIAEKTNGYEEPCPECGEGKLIHAQGCKNCNKCSYSKC